ncbi:DUF3105 domain-containing protein [Actinoplanes utahensis]|uniref:DUF3105 domain-containing protein n=1 Tax=Actinoplanes utahensis TaxID=1869 RepID=UPI00194E0EA7|nr:DUF3105 domain-containing protein [Actinoplanes utahensis]GIF33041.1 hypothetical protein Aut01nite_60270 [Actinoplanes utahensis]
MSMSTPGPERVPSTVKVGKTTGQGNPPSGKPGTGRPGGANRPTGKGKGKKGRKITPVKPGGNGGPIAIAVVVVLIAVGIIGWGVWASIKSDKEKETPWEDRAAAIAGIVNYREDPDKSLTARDHKTGPLTYKLNPPVGGEHNARWQNCMGDVYDAQIPTEHAVHSLEHGAVWVTYKPGLPADQVEALTSKVKGKSFSMLSPFPNQESNISLQAWGYQLKVDSADDPRIDEFIRALSLNASVEPGIPCSGGLTTTGTTPSLTGQ